MGCIGNKKVQKDYKPEGNKQNQGRPVGSQLEVPGNKQTTSIIIDGGTSAYIQTEEPEQALLIRLSTLTEQVQESAPAQLCVNPEAGTRSSSSTSPKFT